MKQAAQSALKLKGASSSEVSILLTGDDEIRRLNHQYRSINAPTDVLSFSYQDSLNASPSTPGLVEPLGDIMISVDAAKLQAQNYGHSLQEELNLLVIHGILHLLGYDDVSESDARIMRDKEQEALRLLGAESDGLVARALA